MAELKLHPEHPNLRICSTARLSTALGILRKQNTRTATFRKYMRVAGFHLTQCVLAERPKLSLASVYPIPILRAGLGLLDGVPFELRDQFAGMGFIDAERDHKTLRPKVNMQKVLPDVSPHAVLGYEVMVATGGSLSASVTIMKWHHARDITIAALICAPEGVALMQKEHPDVTIVTAALDSHLDERGYIVPGLGDAGDRIFDKKD